MSLACYHNHKLPQSQVIIVYGYVKSTFNQDFSSISIHNDVIQFFEHFQNEWLYSPQKIQYWNLKFRVESGVATTNNYTKGWHRRWVSKGGWVFIV